MRAWSEAEARVKAKISSINAKATERAKIEAKVRWIERSDSANRKTEEAIARIRSREDSKKAKKETEEFEARDKMESESAERSKAWAEAMAK